MSELVTLVGVVIPMMTIAGSAVAYVIRIWIEGKQRRQEHFFELMLKIDSTDPIASKLAAVYQLRDFPEHRGFIVRFCETQRHQIVGGNAESLKKEMEETIKFLSV